jgi:prepilin-type N-terminal cleavage/methylation domain-containing protein
MPITPTGRRTRTGFTLLELLVVIGIIVLLLGILLPVYSKVRMAAYQADTQAEVTTIANAVTRYYADFNAYPGPFSNDQIELQGTTPIVVTEINPAATPGGNISMAQNMTLGLMGGLTAATATTATFDPTTVGQGPLSLNPLNPHRYSDYVNNFAGLLTTGHFVDAGGNAAADNVAIPVFVDRFPANPLPILYLRARIGAKGVIGQNQSAGKLQFDLSQISAYTSNSPTLGSPSYSSGGMSGQQGLSGVGTTPYSGTVVTNFPANAGVYFWNSNAAVLSGLTNQTGGVPRSVDQFILISAGKDGTYGTPDDITSFGDVMQ